MATGIDIKTLTASLPDSFKEKGVAKIKTLILKKGQEVKDKLQPKIEEIQSQLPNPEELCLSEPQVQRILNVRNNLVTELNKVQKVLNLLTKSVGATAGFLETLITTAQTVRNLKTALATSANAAPLAPGIVVGAINTANDILDRLKFDELGNSKLNPIQQNIEAASIPIALTAASLKTFVLTLNSVDAFLKKCAPDSDLEKVNDDTLATVLVQQALEAKPDNNSLYQGYSLEIQENQYSPTVTQKRAVAINSVGIIDFYTEYSFTSTPEVLINELKFIIDKNILTTPISNNIPQNITNPTTSTTQTQPTGDPTPLGYLGKTIGEEGALVFSGGQVEDIYQWTGDKWEYVKTVNLNDQGTDRNN